MKNRYAERFETNGQMQRILVKAYGLRFIVVVSGSGGKFNFIPLLTTIGAGIGLLAIPTLLSDFILLNLTKKRKFYRNIKSYDYKKENQEVIIVSKI